MASARVAIAKMAVRAAKENVSMSVLLTMIAWVSIFEPTTTANDKNEHTILKAVDLRLGWMFSNFGVRSALAIRSRRIAQDKLPMTNYSGPLA